MIRKNENAHLSIRPECVRFLPKIPFTAFHNVQATKGGFFIRKCLTRAIRIIFPQPQAFTQTDFNMRSSKPNPWGQAPYTPKRCFASMQGCLYRCKHPAHEAIFNRPTAYAAGVPERGFFRCRRKRMARLGETCVNAHLPFFDERLPFRWLGFGRLCFTVDVCDLRRNTGFRIC